MLVGAFQLRIFHDSMTLPSAMDHYRRTKRSQCLHPVDGVSLRHSWSEQMGTISYQPGEEEDMNTTEESYVVLKFSRAQISPHSYTHVQKRWNSGWKSASEKDQFLNLRQLSPAAQYSQNSGRIELVLLGQ